MQTHLRKRALLFLRSYVCMDVCVCINLCSIYIDISSNITLDYSVIQFPPHNTYSHYCSAKWPTFAVSALWRTHNTIQQKIYFIWYSLYRNLGIILTKKARLKFIMIFIQRNNLKIPTSTMRNPCNFGNQFLKLNMGFYYFYIHPI